MTSIIWNFVFFCIALGVLITIHEGGHYFAARLCKVKVYRFALGFGPVVYSRKLKNGTEFALCLLPLGGYVKMKGEYDDKGDSQDKGDAVSKSNALDKGSVKIIERAYGNESTSIAGAKGREDTSVAKRDGILETDFAHVVTHPDAKVDDLETTSSAMEPEGDSFSEKTVGQRAFIIAAGPLSNIILAVVLFWTAFMLGVSGTKSVVGEVVPGSIAEQAGFKEFDFIKSIDGKHLENWRDVSVALISGVGSKLNVTVGSDLGKGPERSLELDLTGVALNRNSMLYDDIGMYHCPGIVGREIFIPDGQNSSAAQAGLKNGDSVIAIDGVETKDWYAVHRALKSASLDGVDITVLRNGEQLDFHVVPMKMTVKDKEEPVPYFGIGVEVKPIPGFEMYSNVSYGPIDAIPEAVKETWKFSGLIFTTMYKLFTGDIGADNISGPIAIAQGAGQSAESGFSYFLQFLALLSVNLGLLNLLPIPILDGGQLVFLAYEKVFGRKMGTGLQTSLLYLGLCVLIGFTFLAIFNDIAFL